MKKILFLLLIFVCSQSVQAEILPLKNYDSGNYYQHEKSLLEMLIYCEKQVFDKNYKKDSMAKRLERLELAVYGALQDGSEAQRIQNIQKAVTNVAAGGHGLQYVTKSRDLSKNASTGNFWSFGNAALDYTNHLHNHYTRISRHKNHFHSHNSYHKHHSHRLPPPCHHYSHRMPPPCKHNYNHNPIINGDFMKNYSLGTSVRILND